MLLNTTQRAKKATQEGSSQDEKEPFIEPSEEQEKVHGSTVVVKESSAFYKAQLMLFSTLACCLNMAFQEALLRLSPKSSNFISFVQHLFITTVSIFTLGLPFGLFGSKPSKIPVKSYLPLVLLNLTCVLANNASINYGVSIPLNMIFKSSSLIANMFLGMFILSHRYPLGKYLAVLFITIGLIVCTFEDYRLKYAKLAATPPSDNVTTTTASLLLSNNTDLFSQTIGIAFLTASLLLSSGTGIYQEYLRNHFGKHPDESLFYVHLLSLPFFALVSYTDLGYHWQLFSESAFEWIRFGTPESLSSSTPISNPIIVFYLFACVLTQYACIRSVYKLTTECASLTVTLVVTNRKFISIIFSIIYFGNPFTVKHWLGTLVVFVGTMLFTFVDFDSKKNQDRKEQIKKTKSQQRLLEKIPQRHNY